MSHLGISALIFIRSSQRFSQEFGGDSHEGTTSAHSSSLREVHSIAKRSNTQATVGVCLVFAMVLFLGYASARIGAHSQPDHNEVANYAFFAIQMGMVIMNMSSVLYARNLRHMKNETKLMAKTNLLTNLRSDNVQESETPETSLSLSFVPTSANRAMVSPGGVSF